MPAPGMHLAGRWLPQVSDLCDEEEAPAAAARGLANVLMVYNSELRALYDKYWCGVLDACLPGLPWGWVLLKVLTGGDGRQVGHGKHGRVQAVVSVRLVATPLPSCPQQATIAAHERPP
jgi:hypothetical protein